jgi:hypothetical protein
LPKKYVNTENNGRLHWERGRPRPQRKGKHPPVSGNVQHSHSPSLRARAPAFPVLAAFISLGNFLGKAFRQQIPRRPINLRSCSSQGIPLRLSVFPESPCSLSRCTSPRRHEKYIPVLIYEKRSLIEARLSFRAAELQSNCPARNQHRLQLDEWS